MILTDEPNTVLGQQLQEKVRKLCNRTYGPPTEVCIKTGMEMAFFNLES